MGSLFNMPILLSLCVTTRNRKEALARLINELSFEFSDEVELVIVDGASTDGTADFVSQHYKNISSILYHREVTNSGLDQGYDQCVSLASGRYCWMLSDDDQIVSGSVSLVLDLIRSSNYDLLVANSEVWDSSLSRCLFNRQINIHKNAIFTHNQMDNLFITTASVLSFIGSVIIKRDVWVERNRESYYGSWFIHIGVIFQNKLDQGAFVIAKPLVKIRYGVASWSGKAFDIWMKSWPSLIWSLPTVSENAKTLVVPKTPGRSLLKHLLFNCHKVDFHTAQRTIPAAELSRRILIRLIYLIPPTICNAIVGLGCYLTFRKRLLMLYDVANCVSSTPISRMLLRRVLSSHEG